MKRAKENVKLNKAAELFLVRYVGRSDSIMFYKIDIKSHYHCPFEQL